MKNKIFFLLMIMTMTVLTACAEKYETQVVTGEIIQKEYDKPETKKEKVRQADGTYKEVKKHKPEEWEIIVAYGDLQKEYEFSNSTIYNQYEEGDKVQLVLTKGIDKEGKVVSQRIEWEEK